MTIETSDAIRGCTIYAGAQVTISKATLRLSNPGRTCYLCPFQFSGLSVDDLADPLFPLTNLCGVPSLQSTGLGLELGLPICIPVVCNGLWARIPNLLAFLSVMQRTDHPSSKLELRSQPCRCRLRKPRRLARGLIGTNKSG